MVQLIFIEYIKSVLKFSTLFCKYDIVLLPHQNRKKLVAKASRSEGVYNRADEPSVTFCEKGAATEHMIKDRSKNGLFNCSVVCCDVYERDGFTVTAIFTSIYAVLKGFTLISTKA